jgi:hypothetical protein
VDQQQMLRDDPWIKSHRIEPRAQPQRRQPDEDRRAQGHQVNRIDARETRPQERTIIEAPVLHSTGVDVAEDEARQDEKQIHPQITLGHQACVPEPKVEMVPEVVDQNPQRRADAQRRQRANVAWIHGLLPPFRERRQALDALAA